MGLEVKPTNPVHLDVDEAEMRMTGDRMRAGSLINRFGVSRIHNFFSRFLCVGFLGHKRGSLSSEPRKPFALRIPVSRVSLTIAQSLLGSLFVRPSASRYHGTHHQSYWVIEMFNGFFQS